MAIKTCNALKCKCGSNASIIYAMSAFPDEKTDLYLKGTPVFFIREFCQDCETREGDHYQNCDIIVKIENLTNEELKTLLANLPYG